MNDFEIISKLGEGAYSKVYKARRKIDGNIYALKKVKLLNLSEKEKQNSINEVRILASVKNQYVIAYKECFIDESDSSLCIIMEYADKGDLFQKITESKKNMLFLDESDIWKYFIMMVKGLKALHELKILHRDLKSANIFLFSDGTAKLGDLNVSKVSRHGLGYTQTGTPYYASPEVWKDQPYDLKSDIWSLGCILFEMISLKPPFRAENMEGLYNKVIKGNFGKIPDKFSKDLFDVLHVLLQVQAINRPNCDQILKMNQIAKRIDNGDNAENQDENNLLSTIRIPKNLFSLIDRLPKSNYEKEFVRNDRKMVRSLKEDETRSKKTRILGEESLPNIDIKKTEGMYKNDGKRYSIRNKNIIKTKIDGNSSIEVQQNEENKYSHSDGNQLPINQNISKNSVLPYIKASSISSLDNIPKVVQISKNYQNIALQGVEKKILSNKNLVEYKKKSIKGVKVYSNKNLIPRKLSPINNGR